ncbi:hypothetical protein ACFFX0_01170 [Citricoccus parietis]|uniref:Uncharacterized protein n=1 Tax=Citricoccus parietis TaxID=592307 RepID=A0ABV5FTC6_9MICC
MLNRPAAWHFRLGNPSSISYSGGFHQIDRNRIDVLRWGTRTRT